MELKYEVTVKNKTPYRVNRNRNVILGDQEQTVLIDQKGFREMKACRFLEIKDVKFACPICETTYKNKGNLINHIKKEHPEYKNQIK